MGGTDLSKFRYYYYNPSVAAAAVFCVLFALVSIRHGMLLVKHRTWYFIPFFIGCLFEVIGMAGRAVSASQTPDWTLDPYIVQSLMTLLAPTLFAASIYMILGRLVRLLDAEQFSLIRSRWLTKFFVMGDVLSFLSQGAGGGMLATAKSAADQDRGNNIILAGLGIQVVFFGFFIITAVIFHIRLARNPTARSYAVTAPWQIFLYILYASSLLIMIRSLYRMVEYGMGINGPLMKSEGYFFGLDIVLMLIVMIMYAWFHPSRIISGRSPSQAARDVDPEAATEGYTEGYRMVDSISVGKHPDIGSSRPVTARDLTQDQRRGY